MSATRRTIQGGGVAALALALVFAGGQAEPPLSQPSESAAPGTRFAWVDVYLDSGDLPLAAYQFELSASAGDFKIVGIEGGEHVAFAEPPYYDPAALHNNRVILAAFSTARALPAGRMRVARVHVMLDGNSPHYTARLRVAATADGSEVSATIQLEEGAPS